MDASPLISDGQAVAVVSAIVAGFGTVAAAIKWGVGRIVKAIDDQTADSKLMRDALAEMKAEVREGREDIRELRIIATRLDAAVQLEAQDPPSRRSRRAATPAGGVARRASTDSDR